jgi:hypothetical protein
MAEFTQKRYGELSRGVLALLAKESDGLAASEALNRLAKVVPPTAFEQEDWPPRQLACRPLRHRHLRPSLALNLIRTRSGNP